MDANLNTTRIGARAPGEGRMQTGASAAFTGLVLPIANF